MTGRFCQDLAGVEVTRPHPVPSNLSASLGSDSTASMLRRKVTQDTAQARHKMDGFLAQLTGQGGEVGGRRTGIPRCSSADRLNRSLRDWDVQSDVTGASPIAKDSNLCE
jgi:hypothetical protein